MNKILWKLHVSGERMWMLANSIAQQSSVMGRDGKGMAVVAEETRNMANKIYEIVERAMFEDEEVEQGKLRDIAFMMNLLALNSAIECSRLGVRGQPAVVCTEDIRTIAYNISILFGEEKSEGYYGYTPIPQESYGITPIPKDRIKSSDHNNEFIFLNVAGVHVVELLSNIKEICICLERTDTHVKVRGMDVPLIDCYKALEKTQDEQVFVILHTPWAEQNKVYAVAADVLGLFFSPTCIPANIPSGIPLAEYVREYWESENDLPFIFMDWTKMVG